MRLSIFTHGISGLPRTVLFLLSICAYQSAIVQSTATRTTWCTTYAWAGGNFLTFDGQFLHYAGPRSYLLSRRTYGRRACVYSVYVTAQNYMNLFPVVSYVRIGIRGQVYEFGLGNTLKVNGNPTSVPFAHSGLHHLVYYNSPDLQFVAEGCGFTVAFNGFSTVVLSATKGIPGSSEVLSGIAGDCDGDPTNDFRTRSGKDVRRSKYRDYLTVTSFAKGRGKPCRKTAKPKCGRKTFHMAKRRCYLLSTKRRGTPFGACHMKTPLKPFYWACVYNWCELANNPKLQRRFFCETLRAAARKCAKVRCQPNLSRICPTKCGKNKKFVLRMPACPKTCESHFFSTKRCYRLPQREGCVCKRGFLQDGMQCVRPNKCKCIEGLCIDAFGNRRCRAYKRQKLCRRKPRLMRRYCNLTCGFCHHVCVDQLSRRHCAIARKRKLCRRYFYRTLCAATCRSRSCKCKHRQTVVGKCNRRRKYRVIYHIRYYLVYSRGGGVCKKSTVVRYRKCGRCVTGSVTRRGRCNYCKGQRRIQTITVYVEEGGRRRCLRSVTNRYRRCSRCNVRRNGAMMCKNNKYWGRYVTYAKRHGCYVCRRSKKWIVTRTSRCIRRTTTKSACRNGKMIIFYKREIARSCRCRFVVYRKRVVDCKCKKAGCGKWRCNRLSQELSRRCYTYRLIRWRCRRRYRTERRRRPCNTRRRIVKYACHKATGRRYASVTTFRLRRCRCRSVRKYYKAGYCMCRKRTTMKCGRCRHYFRNCRRYRYHLVGHSCKRERSHFKKRCACKPTVRVHRCINNDVRLTGYILYKLDRRNNVCKEINRVRRKQIVCNRVRVVRGPCNRGTAHEKKRYVRRYAQRVQQCHCREYLASKSLEVCDCKATTFERRAGPACIGACASSSTTCVGNCDYYKDTFSYVFRNGSCVAQRESRAVQKCCCAEQKSVKEECINNGQDIRKITTFQRLTRTMTCETSNVVSIVNVGSQRKGGFQRSIDNPETRADGSFVRIMVYLDLKDCAWVERRVEIKCYRECKRVGASRVCDNNQRIKSTYIRGTVVGCECKYTRVINYSPLESCSPVDPERRCDENGVLHTTIKTRRYVECKCKETTKTITSRCGCSKATKVVRTRCFRNYLWKVKVKCLKLVRGRCVWVYRWILKRVVRCSSRMWYRRKCNKHSGVEILYRCSIRPRNCRCKPKCVRVRRHMCSCRRKNWLIRNRNKRTRCNRRTHVKCTVIFTYKLVGSPNRRRCKLTKRRYKYPTKCRRPTHKYGRCIVALGYYRIFTRYYRRRHCRCVKASRSRRVSCRCKAPRELTHRRRCDRASGAWILKFRRERYSRRARRCVAYVVTTRKPLRCKAPEIKRRRKCPNGTYSEVRIYYKKLRSKCRCVRRFKKTHCACGRKIFRGKCGATHRSIKVLYFKRDAQAGCVFSHRKIYRRRCRCDKAKKQRRCKRGLVHITTTTYEMVRRACVAQSLTRKYRPRCRKPRAIVKRMTSCNRRTGYRCIKYYKKFVSKSHCKCMLRLFRTRKCRCAKCHARVARPMCTSSGYPVTKIVYFVPYVRHCRKTCKRIVKVVRRKRSCGNKVRLAWGRRCNKQTCRRYVYKLFYRRSKCGCRRLARRTRRWALCCCHGPRKARKVCRNGKMYYIKYKYTMNRSRRRCHRRKIVRRIKSDCYSRPNVRSKWSSCNRRSCMKYRYVYAWRSHSETCHCRKVRIRTEHKHCCCNKKGYTKKYCAGDCWHYLTVRYSTKYGKCRMTRSVRKMCKKCGGVGTKVGRCYRNTCLATHYFYRYVIRGCECRRVTRPIPRKCCCPPPVPWTRRCRADGSVERRRISYVLDKYQCAEKVKIRRTRMDCGPRKHFRKVSRCHKRTCRQRVRHCRVRMRRCKCHTKCYTKVRRCCCKRRGRTYYRCVRKRLYHAKYRVTRRMQFRNYKCHWVTKRSLLYKVKLAGCRNIRRELFCNRKTRKQTIVIYIRRLKRCACRTVRKRKIVRICHCDAERVVRGDCGTNCQRRVTTYTSRLVNGNCVVSRTFKLEPCCCTPIPNGKRVCDPTTGNYGTRINKANFVNGVCIRYVTYNEERVDCSGIAIKKRAGPCDTRTGRAIDVEIVMKKNSATCTCEPVTRNIPRVCSCTHLKCETTKACKNNVYNVFFNKCYQLVDGVCSVRTREQSIATVCDDKVTDVRICNTRTCKATRTITRQVVKNCTCVPKATVSTDTCCCRKPERTQRCRGRYMEYIKTEYSLNADFSGCKKIVSTRRKSVYCKRTSRLLRREPCNRRTCRTRQVRVYFGVRRCRCVPMRRKVRHMACCCRKRRTRRHCRKHRDLVTTIIRYRLYRGRCYKRQKHVVKRVVCHAPKITITPCNPATKRRVTCNIWYTQKNCKCCKHKKYTSTVCKCRPSRIRKQSCKRRDGTRRKRRGVYKIHYGAPPDCKKAAVKIYEEACYCAKSSTKRHCISNSYRFVTTRHTPVRVGGRMRCSTVTSSRDKRLRCKKGRTYYTKCRNFRRTVVTEFYQMRKCICRRIVTRARRACNCHLKTKKFRICAKNQGYFITVCKKYYSSPGMTRCSMFVTKSAKPIVCHRRVRHLREKVCRRRMNFGYARKHIKVTKYRRGCRCRSRRHVTYRLCRCFHGRYKRFCAGGHTRVVKRTMYKKMMGVCIPSQLVIRRRITCMKPRLRIVFGRCNRRCWVRARVLVRFRRKCKCYVRRLTFRNKCCTPPDTQRSSCNVRTGVTTTVRTTHRIVSRGILYRDQVERNIIIERKVVISRRRVTRKKVKCGSRRHFVTCSRRSGAWKRVTVRFQRIGCICRERVTVKHGRCKCRPPWRRVGSCKRHFQTIYMKRWLLKGRRCYMRRSTRRRRCSCARRRRRTTCDRKSGAWRICSWRVRFIRRTRRCHYRRRCRRRVPKCQRRAVRRTPCHPRTHKQTIRVVYERLQRRTCRCRRLARKSTRYCSCYHLKKSTTFCKDGAKVVVTTIFKLRRHRCVPKTIMKTEPMVCQKSRVEYGPVINDTTNERNGYREKRFISFKAENCLCKESVRVEWVPYDCDRIVVYKRSETRVCRNNMWYTKTTSYARVGDECVIQTGESSVQFTCSNAIRTRRSGCFTRGVNQVRTITETRLEAKNCQCVSVHVRNTTEICSCGGSSSRSECQDNAMRVTFKVTAAPNAARSICLFRTTETRAFVDCGSKRVVVDSNRKDCKFTRSVYVNRAVSCVCKRHLISRRERSYCCKKKTVVKRCDPSTHVRYTTRIWWELFDGTCNKRTAVSSYRRRCERIPIKVTYSKCSGKYREKTVCIFKSVGCGCKRSVRVIRELCGCRTGIRVKRGRCKRSGYALDRYMFLKFQRNPRRCMRRTVFHKRRCRCRKSTVRRRCRNQRTRETTRTSYRLKRRSHSQYVCVRSVRVTRKTVGCTRRPRLVKVVTSKCNRRTRWHVSYTSVYVRAKRCRCIYNTRVVRHPCNCARLHPVKRWRKCARNGRAVTHYTRRYFLIKRQCRPRVSKRTVTIACHGRYVRRGKCRRCRRWVRIYHRRAVGCKCRARVTSRRRERCCCRPARTVRSCVVRGTTVQYTRTYYRIVRRRSDGLRYCVRQRSVRRRRVPCHVGVRRKRNVCNAIANTYCIRTTKRWLSGCQCRRKQWKRVCHCRCPKSRVTRRCYRGYKVVITKYVSSWRKCRCVRRKTVRVRLNRCVPRRPRVTVSKCVHRGRKGYRVIKKWCARRTRRCGCKHYAKKRIILCWVDPNFSTKRNCDDDGTLTITKYKDMVRGNRLVTVVVNQKKRRTECKRGYRRVVCNKKTGVKTITTCSNVIYNCMCKKRVQVTHGTCRIDCDTKPRLLRTTGCMANCYKYKVYAYKQLVEDSVCESRTRRVAVRCCCDKRRHMRKACHRGKGYVITAVHRRKLVNGRCQWSTRYYRKYIRCKRRRTFKIIKKANGRVVKIVSWYVRVGCKCKPKHKKYRGYYKCLRKPAYRRVCRGNHYHITKVKWSLNQLTGCVAKRSTRREPVPCPDAYDHDTKCVLKISNGRAKENVRVTYRHENCRCEPVERRTRRACLCDEGGHSEDCVGNTRVSTVYSYELNDQRTACVRKEKITKVAIRCAANERMTKSTACDRNGMLRRIFVRHVLQRCQCVPVTRVQTCACACPPATVRKECSADGRTETTIVRRSVVQNCACVAREVRTGTRAVPCQAVEMKRSGCGQATGCDQTVTTISGTLRNCICHKTQVEERTKCCCAKRRICRKRCIKAKQYWKKTCHKEVLVGGRCVRTTTNSYMPVVCKAKPLIRVSRYCHRGYKKVRTVYWVSRNCRCGRKIKRSKMRCPCYKKSGVLFIIIDASLFDYNIEIMVALKKALGMLMGNLPVGKGGYRVVLTTVGHKSRVVFDISRARSMDSLMEAIEEGQDMMYTGQTNMHTGFALVRKMLKNCHQKNRKIVIIGTSKHYKAPAKSIITGIKDRGVQVYAVSLKTGSGHHRSLISFTSEPAEKFYREYNTAIHMAKKLGTYIISELCGKVCGNPKCRVGRCRSNCMKTSTTYYYIRTASGDCVPKRVVKYFACCCKRRTGATVKKCIGNRLYQHSTRYRFSARHRSCYTFIRSKEIAIPCGPASSTRRLSECVAGKIMYEKVTKRVENCVCKTRRVRIPQFCGCPPNEVKRVCRNNRWESSVVTHTRDGNNGCRSTAKSSVAIPAPCPAEVRVVQPCDPLTCMKVTQVTGSRLDNCVCRATIRFENDQCCCPTSRSSSDECTNGELRRTTVTRVLVQGKCVSQKNTVVIPVSCKPSKVLSRGVCRLRRGNAIWRRECVVLERRQACTCVAEKRYRLRICRCRRGGRVKRQCTQKGRVLVFRRLTYSQVGDTCHPIWKIVRTRPVKCNKRLYIKMTPCVDGWRYVRSYALVPINCRCRRRLVSRRRVSCRCSKKSKVVSRKCQKPDYLCVTRCFYKRNSKGVCVKKTKEDCRDIVCKKEWSFRVGRCWRGHFVVTVRHCEVTNCRRAVRTYRTKYPCGRRCYDALPRATCRGLSAGLIRGCDEAGDVRDKLCRRTCGRCRKPCKHPVMVSRYKQCIVREARYAGRFVSGPNLRSKGNNLAECRAACLARPTCVSFDWFFGARNEYTCVFATVNRASLADRIAPDVPEFGATADEVKKYNARMCYLYERKCRKKCPRKVTEKPLTKCHCRHKFNERDGRPVSGCLHYQRVRYCFRKRVGRRCVRKCRTETRPCNHLTRSCKREFIYRGPCRRNGYRAVTRAYFVKVHFCRRTYCVVRFQSINEPCMYCQKGAIYHVGRCRKGRRRVIIVQRVSKGSRQCKWKRSVRVYPCGGRCLACVRRRFTPCHRGSRVLTVSFMTWRGKCCRRVNLRRRFRCHRRCPRDVRVAGKCYLGSRLTYRKYYVYFRRRCYCKIIACRGRCRSGICANKLPLHDCIKFRKERLCRKRTISALCRKTCGRCGGRY